MEQLLTITGLKTWFSTEAGDVRAVDDVDLAIDAGRTLAVVGESGSGKSVMALSIMQIVPQPPGKILAGSIRFKGVDLLEKSEKEKVGYQIEEVIRVHQKKGRASARRRAVQLMQRVGIPAAGQRSREFPHRLSGGMRQRVMIAMALACRPQLLIADEPTTALDVTVQAQILDLMRNLQQEFGTAILLISHDLGIVAEMADHVAVM